jgi:peptide/nickel transport system permease protein
MTVANFIIRRLGRLAATVFIIASIVFFLIRVIPGDPALVIAGIDSDPADIEAIRDRLGMSDPMVLQYLRWLWKTLSFDFGESFFSGEPVTTLILSRFPITLALASLSFLFALVIAVPVGVLSAVYRWTIVDYGGMVFSQLGMAVPGFWLGILLLMAFAVRIRLFPLFGADSFLHFVLPALALGIGRSALLTRMVRSSMIEQLSQEYMVTAQAKGLKLTAIRYRHALKNALLPVITIAGIQFGGLLGGSIIIEQVFSIPGLGRLLLSGIYGRDFPVIQGGVIFIAVVFSLVNFLVDVLYTVVNPRIRIR